MSLNDSAHDDDDDDNGDNADNNECHKFFINWATERQRCVCRFGPHLM